MVSLFVPLLTACARASIVAPVVQTTYGPVRGTTSLGGAVDVFHSIPFAAPPVGHLRFRAPVPPASWTEPLDVAAQPSVCTQMNGILSYLHLPFAKKGSEDCLYLMVYTPKRNGSGNAAANRFPLKPVLLFIHGGGFVEGSAYGSGGYEGSMLAREQDVVVVSIQYRLGTFGFLGVPELDSDSGVVGNYAMLDQRMAIRWAKNNIQNFRGDPDRITIFGESAGGASVCYHFTSPATQPLAAGFIMESGHCALQFVNKSQQHSFGLSFAAHVGCTTRGDALVKCLQSKSAEELLYPQQPTSPTWRPAEPGVMPIGGPIFPWCATVDGTDEGLLDFPFELLESGRFDRSLPLIAGHNTDEMFCGTGASSVEDRITIFVAFVPDWVNHTQGVSVPLKPEYAAPVLSHFLQRPISHDDIAAAQKFYPETEFPTATEAISQMLIDSSGWIGHAHDRRVVDAVRRHGGTIWSYRFAYKGNYEHVDHASEIPFVFQQCGRLPMALRHRGSCQGSQLNPTNAEKGLMRAMGKYWANFATAGQPGEGTSVWDLNETVVLDLPISTEKAYRLDADLFWRAQYASGLDTIVI